MERPDDSNLDRIRRAYEAFNRDDFDAALELVHPKIEWGRAGTEAPLRGVDAVRAWMEPDAFESMSVELEEMVEEGNRILVRQRARGRGAGSGIEMEMKLFFLWTFDDEG